MIGTQRTVAAAALLVAVGASVIAWCGTAAAHETRFDYYYAGAATGATGAHAATSYGDPDYQAYYIPPVDCHCARGERHYSRAEYYRPEPSHWRWRRLSRHWYDD
jgi:hypothetical protein